jgi:hypothetical protein
MVAKVNGNPEQGVWFERDVSFVEITSTASDFEVADFDVNGIVDQVVRVMQTRGTVLGISREDDNVLHLVYGHAGGEFTVAILDELKAELDAIADTGTFSLVLGTGWTTNGSATTSS